MKNKLLSILTPEQLKQELTEVGSATKIAKKYGINPMTVYSAFKICGIECIVKPNRSDLLTKEILEQSYAEIGSLKGVARKLGVDAGTIKRYMQEHNLEFKPQVRYNCDHNFFSQENELSFYVAGFIAADGCVKIHSECSYQLQIGLAQKDKDFLEKIKNILKAESPIHDYLVKNSERNPEWNDTWKSEITITSRQMFDDLARFNIVPRKSLIYTFPEWIKTHPLKHHFIRGYNDGDGSFYFSLGKDKLTKQLYFSLRGTPEFLIDVRYILEQECNLDERNTEIRISNEHGVLEYGGNNIVKKIADYLYKDASVFLARKKKVIYEDHGCIK